MATAAAEPRKLVLTTQILERWGACDGGQQEVRELFGRDGVELSRENAVKAYRQLRGRWNWVFYLLNQAGCKEFVRGLLHYARGAAMYAVYRTSMDDLYTDLRALNETDQAGWTAFSRKYTNWRQPKRIINEPSMGPYVQCIMGFCDALSGRGTGIGRGQAQQLADQYIEAFKGLYPDNPEKQQEAMNDAIGEIADLIVVHVRPNWERERIRE